MDRRERACLCFLHRIPGVGQRTLWFMKKSFGAFEPVLNLSAKALYEKGFSERTVASILEHRKGDPLAYLDSLEEQGICISTAEDPDYPPLLAKIFDPPYIFYYYGVIDLAHKFTLAVVGSRAATYYGKNEARRLSGELAREGVVIVSGMARGIDTQAHLGALESGGTSIAVLGSGLDVVYPAENRELYSKLAQKGLVISDFVPGTHPEPGNFPARNRIISGLSYGILVVEARRKSGALITVDYALEQGRDVFAIPGPINSKNSEGTNQLLKDGAFLVTEYRDVLDEYPAYFPLPRGASPEQNSLFGLDKDEAGIIECMGHEPIHFDELILKKKLSMGALSELLMCMELKGIIRCLPGNYYVKV